MVYVKAYIKNGIQRGWNLSHFNTPGQLIYEYNSKNGKEDGLSKRWNKNGQLIEEMNYKNGVPYGLKKVWLDNGELASEVNYIYDYRIKEKE